MQKIYNCLDFNKYCIERKMGRKMKRKNAVILIVILLSLLVAGCATIISGTTQNITINSNVKGARVLLNGAVIGKTPLTTKIKRESDAIITVSHKDYETQTIRPSTTINPTVFFAAISFVDGLFSTTTDYATGAAYKYSPSSYFVHLEPKNNTDLGFKEEVELRKFAMLNLSQISSDAQEDGEYILTLADLMKSKYNQEEALETIKLALDSAEGDQLAFGDQIIDSFRK